MIIRKLGQLLNVYSNIVKRSKIIRLALYLLHKVVLGLPLLEGAHAGVDIVVNPPLLPRLGVDRAHLGRHDTDGLDMVMVMVMVIRANF